MEYQSKDILHHLSLSIYLYNAVLSHFTAFLSFTRNLALEPTISPSLMSVQVNAITDAAPRNRIQKQSRELLPRAHMSLQISKSRFLFIAHLNLSLAF